MTEIFMKFREKFQSSKNNQPKIILVTGYRGCGKDYISDLIIKEFKNTENFKILRYTISDKLKKFISKMYSIPLNHIEKYKREPKAASFEIGYKKYNMRSLLVHTANTMRDFFGTEFWIKILYKDIEKDLEISKENDKMLIPLITDVRFLAEVDFLQKKFSRENMLIINIASNCETCESGNQDEKDLIDIETDINFFNNCKDSKDFSNSFEELIYKIKEFIKK